MSRLKKINKQLKQPFGGAVSAECERGCVVLRGKLVSWDDVVAAGHLVARSRAYRRGGFVGLVNHIEFLGGEIPPMRVPALRDSALDGQAPDVLVVGAGIIGCAIARELTRHDLDVLIVEKEHDVGMQASSRNDGMVHPGIDLKKRSQKHHFNLRGNAMYDKLAEQLGVEFSRSGQYVCFSQRWIKPLLYLTLLYWKWMGIPAKVLGKKQLFAREPNLAPDLRCALFFPSAGSVCPYGLTIALAENAVQNGARLSLDTAVVDIETDGAGRITSVQTNRGRVFPRIVVNAAGVFSDEIAKMAGDEFFTIHARRGTNAILDKKYAHTVVETIAAKFGTSSRSGHTKGGGIVKTASGNTLVGPDAHETFERECYETARSSVAATFERQRHTSPALTERQIITYFTGVRAATYEEDFIVRDGVFCSNIVHAAGIQSPGLSAAPAIGERAAALAVAQLKKLGPVADNPNFDPVRAPIVKTAALSDAERDALIAQNPDYGQIVCRCEEISRGEVLDALRRAVPCDTVDGVKRRVRPGMGRCQGGFCAPLVASAIAEEKNIPLDRVLKNEPGSELLFGPTKEGGGAI